MISIGYEDYLEDFENSGYDNMEYMILQIGYSNFRLNEGLLRNQVGITREKSIKDIIENLKKGFEIFI